MSSTGAVATPAGAAVAALVLAAVLAEPARRLAVRYGFFTGSGDTPSAATPYLGGLAIAFAALAPSIAVIRGVNFDLWVQLAAATLVVMVGVLADTDAVTRGVRFGSEVLLAIAVVATGARLGLPGPDIVDTVATVCFIVAATEAFAQLDCADGALATVGAVTSAPVAVALFFTGQVALGLLLICLAMACGGFLGHNIWPARILMGNAGSRFIGFVIASSVIQIRATGFNRAAILVLVLLVPAVDAAVTRLPRIGARGGTVATHAVHRLRRLGVGANAAVAILGFVAASAGFVALLVCAEVVSGRLSLAVAALVAAAAIGPLSLIRARPTPGATVLAVTQRQPLEQRLPDSNWPR